MNIKRRSISFAPGFPRTIRSTAKREVSNHLRRFGIGGKDADDMIVLVHGSTAFRVPMNRYASLSVAPALDAQGSYAIKAKQHDGTEAQVAVFGSEDGANAGFAALMKAHSGIGPKSFGWVKGVGIVMGFLGLTVLVGAVFSTLSAAGGEGVAHAAPETRALAQQGPNGAEPSLEQLESLAAGNYKFNPQLKAPAVDMPTLACAVPNR